MARAPRGLGDVLHYFISDEEQAQARARAAAPKPSGPVRWAIAADVARPLAGAIVVDLATALARRGLRVEVIATVEPSRLLPSAAGVRWRAIAADADALAHAVAEVPAESALLVALPLDGIAARLGSLPVGLLRGVVLPVAATPSGITSALAALRSFGPLGARLEVGLLVVGAASSAEAEAAHQRLAGAAKRQLGLSPLRLGELPRDASSARSLLRGVPIVELDADAPAAKNLAAAGARLAGGDGSQAA